MMAVAQERPPPTRRVGGQFLAGAGGRLLPASVPLRWFAAAAVFHALAWLALAAGASQWPGWRGGPGWPLAALHLVTVGTLVSSAIGASLQLLPVATRQPVRGPRLAALLWWLYVPGAALLALGMGLAQPAWMVAGAALVLPVLGIWGLLLALNLRGARGMPGVVLHGWGAAASLLVLMGSAAALVALWNGTPLLPRDDARALHAAAGVIGVMGLLVLGLSSILLPLFALAPVPDEGAQLRSGATVCVALLLMALAAFAPAGSDAAQVLRWTALLAAAWALATHVRAMRRSWAEGLRSDLGRSGRLFRIGWGGAALAISFTAIGLVRGHDGADLPWGPLAVLAALGGWLLSILFGVLQRILPFLASLHAARRAGRRPPTPSALTAEGPLRVHEAAHLAALVLLAAALVNRSPAWLLAAAALGFVGALAFVGFVGVLALRLHRAARRSATDA